MSYTKRGLQLRAGSIGAFTLVAVLMAASASASSIQVSGSTAGCFGAGCDTFGSPAIHGTYGLALSGADFDVFTDDLGLASNLPLGSFARGNVNVSSSTGSVPFTPQGVFFQPTGIGSGEQLTESLDLNNNGSEDVYGEIGNATFTYGSTALQESVTPVPEPASIGLFGVGLMMVARRVRRRKS